MGAELFDKSKKAAIHWLRPGEARPEWGFTKPMLEIALGTHLDERGFRERSTRDREKVTCRQCYEQANPEPTVQW